MPESGRFYWLKLKRDFFKRHDIRIVEEMPNGKDYLLFYLKLLLESIDHEGALRFSDTIPYDDKMLSVVTNTNIDVVRSAMKVFLSLNMVSVFDDKTIFMSEVSNLIGSETQWAQKKRVQRSKVDNVLALSSDCPTEIDIEKELEIELEKDIERSASLQVVDTPQKSKVFRPPSVDDVAEYCRERKNNVDPEAFVNFYASKGWMVGKNHMKDWRAAVRTWERERGGSNVNGSSNIFAQIQEQERRGF